MAGEREKCMAAGMDGFLTKPIDIDRLCEVLDKCGLRTSPAQLPATTGPVPMAASVTVSAVPESPPVNLSRLNELTDGDLDFATELLETFRDSVAVSLEEIAQHAAQEQRVLLGRAAHRLKGAAANIHAETVADLAGSLELAANGATMQEIATQVATLRAQTLQTLEFLRTLQQDGFRSTAA
jgi:HPt (histidine-containing phosphotransfer) domain-containing protein